MCAVPTSPFFGQLGVAPPHAWGRLDSRPPSRHGGNIDNKDLRPGTRLFLPIAVAGALFSVGDGHAAQGHGEINQTAIETSLDGRLRLTVRRDFSLEWPIAVTPSHLMTMAVHEDLDDAARLAMRSMIRVLESHYRMPFHDAYRLCSIAADMHVTQFVNGNRGIHVMLARALFGGMTVEPDLMTTCNQGGTSHEVQPAVTFEVQRSARVGRCTGPDRPCSWRKRTRRQ